MVGNCIISCYSCNINKVQTIADLDYDDISVEDNSDDNSEDDNAIDLAQVRDELMSMQECIEGITNTRGMALISPLREKVLRAISMLNNI